MIISVHVVAVSTILVDNGSLVRNIRPVVGRLLFFRAKRVLVGEDGTDSDLVAHIVQVVVPGVLPERPPVCVPLPLSPEIVLCQVFEVPEADFASFEWGFRGNQVRSGNWYC